MKKLTFYLISVSFPFFALSQQPDSLQESCFEAKRYAGQHSETPSESSQDKGPFADWAPPKEGSIAPNTVFIFDIQNQTVQTKVLDSMQTQRIQDLRKTKKQHIKTTQVTESGFSDLEIVDNPHEEPWCFSARTTSNFDYGSSYGSAILVDPRFALISAHQIYDIEQPNPEMLNSLAIWPGHSSSLRKPFGSATFSSGINQVMLFSEWLVNENWSYDIALVSFSRPIGAISGWIPMAYSEDDDFFLNTVFYNPSYPSESNTDYALNEDMYYQYGSFENVVCEHLLSNTFKPFKGQSGSGFYDSDAQFVYGVASKRFKPTFNLWEAHYVKLTEETIDAFNFLIDQVTPDSYDLMPLDVYVGPDEITPIMAGESFEEFSFIIHNYSSQSWEGSVNIHINISHSVFHYLDDIEIDSFIWNGSLGPKESKRVEPPIMPIIPLDVLYYTYHVNVVLDIDDANPDNNNTELFGDFAVIDILPPSLNLSNGSVTPNPGNDLDTYHFSVYYQANLPPDPNSIKVVVNGTEHIMTPSGSNWIEGVQFTKNLSGFSVGTQHYYFTGSAGGESMRLPASGQYSFNVLPSTEGWDAEVKRVFANTNAFSGSQNLRGYGEVKNNSNPGNTYNNLPFKFEFFNPDGALIHEENGVINSIAPNEFIVVESEQIFISSSDPDGLYQIRFSVFPNLDNNPHNNSKSIHVYKGQTGNIIQFHIENDHAFVWLHRIDNHTHNFGGKAYRFRGINTSQERAEFTLDDSDSPWYSVYYRDYNFFANDDNFTVSFYSYSGQDWGQFSFGQTNHSIIFYSSTSAMGFPGEQVEFTATSAETFSNRTPDFYGQYEFAESWFSHFERFNNNKSIRFVFNIPEDATHGNNYLDLAAYLNDTDEHVMTHLRIRVLQPPPEITSLSAYSFAAGEEITISGNNFGMNTGQVKFNALSGTVTSWSDTEITCIVPQEVESGVLTVIRGSTYSNGIDYEAIINDFLLFEPSELDFEEVFVGDFYLLSYELSFSDQAEQNMITITAPPGFQLSLAPQNPIFWNSILILPVNHPSFPHLPSLFTIYVRFSPTQSGPYAGYIAHTLTGIETQYLEVCGVGVHKPVLTTATTTLNFGEILINETKTLSYAISGSNLIDDLEITAPNGFRISTNELSGFEDNLSIEHYDGIINQTIYVRFEPNTGITYYDQIIHSIEGAETVHVSVEGIGIVPPCPGMPTVMDVDGNIYNTVLIGDQCWLRENLRVTSYNNGEALLSNLSESEWSNTTQGAYAIYPYEDVEGIGSSEEMVAAYGKLYNWHAVSDTRGLCPVGWSVPNEPQTETLIVYLIGNYDNIFMTNVGKILKSCRTVDSPLGGTCNTNVHPRWDEHATLFGTDIFGFSSLPAGERSRFGDYALIGESNILWTRSAIVGMPRAVMMHYNAGWVDFFHLANKKDGFSVRCLRDVPAHSSILIINSPQLEFGNVPVNECSIMSYQLNGIGLTDDVAISTPPCFQISTHENTGFEDAISVPHIDGIVDKTIYVQFCPDEVGEYNGQITNASAGTDTKIVEVLGDGIQPCTINCAYEHYTSCIVDPPFNLSISHLCGDYDQLSGEYSGIGVYYSEPYYYFDPDIGLGVYTITYCYTDNDGCTACTTFYMEVKPVPEVSCPDDFEVSIDTPPFLLTGGTPLGGEYVIIGGDYGQELYFDPAELGPGNHTIKYYYPYYSYLTIPVIPPPPPICTDYCEFIISVTEPEIEYELPLNFGAGFTWFSINVNPGSMNPNDLFADLSPCENDRIIGQTNFATFFNDSWVGSLTELNHNQSYVMELCSQQSATITGNPASISPISLNAGFTWLGYLPQSTIPINTALANVSPPPAENDRLIGQTTFATYFNNQWVGSLSHLKPGDGYVIDLSNSVNLEYPAASAKQGDAKGKMQKPLISPTGKYPAQNMQHNMTMIAQLITKDGRQSFKQNNVVYAHVGNECRGIANVTEHNGTLFLTIGSNLQAGEAVNFRVWLDEANELFEIRESVSFEAFRALGTMDNPFVLTLDAPLGEGFAGHQNWHIGDPYPNPFTGSTYIPYYVGGNSEVSLKVYNSVGQVVFSINDIHEQAGNQWLTFERGSLQPGVYHYRMEISAGENSRIKPGRVVIM